MLCILVSLYFTFGIFILFYFILLLLSRGVYFPSYLTWVLRSVVSRFEEKKTVVCVF